MAKATDRTKAPPQDQTGNGWAKNAAWPYGALSGARSYSQNRWSWSLGKGGNFTEGAVLLALNWITWLVFFFLVPFSKNFKLDDLFFSVHLRAVYRVMYRAFLVHLSAKLEISLYKWTLNALVTLLKLPFINESFHQLVSLDGTMCTSENSSKLSLSGAQIWERSRGSSGQWRQ